MPSDDLDQIQEPEPDDESPGTADRLALERRALENERLREQNENLEADRSHRYWLANGISLVALIWVIGVLTLVILHGVSSATSPDGDTWFMLPTAALVALLGSPGFAMATAIIIIARSVFPVRTNN